IKGQREELLVRARNKEYNAEGLRNIVVKNTPGGGVVHLYQVADVRDRWADNPDRSYLNDQTSVVVTVQNTLEEDMLSITDQVKEYIDNFNQRETEVQATVISDSSITLRQRMNTLQTNGIQGFIIVTLLLAMFLHWRLALWVALAIPISFAGMFLVASLVGVSINVISLFGMILVIGILVDDGIVIGENIYSQYEAGESRIPAAINGTMQVLPAVFSAILTTVIAFATFLFLDGRLGDFFAEMALVVIFSLTFSLIEGATILPTHVAHSRALSPDRTPNKIQAWFERLMFFFRDRLYAPVLRFAMNYRWLTLALCLATLLITFGMFMGGFIRSTFFPNIERDDVVVTLQMPAGTREDITQYWLDHIADAAWQANDTLSEAYFNNEKEAIRFVEVNLGPTTYQGTVRIAILEGDYREDLSLQTVVNTVREASGPIDAAEIFSFGSASPFGKPISVSLVGDDYAELQKATTAIKTGLSELTELADVVDNNQEGLREVNITLKDKARYLGLDLQDIVGQVRQGFFGAEAQRLQRGEDEVRVWVRYDEADRHSIADLERMRVRFPDGTDYPLGELADLSLQRGIIAINHIDGKREIKVEADVANNDVSVSDVTDAIKAHIVPEILADYPSVTALYEGQNREQAKSAESMQKVLPVVLSLMFFVIAVTFRSIGQTVVLFLLLPFGLVGAGWGHYIMGAPISFFSLLGIIALIGIIVNDGLVFIATYNDNLREGDDQMEALYKAGISRFRPIVLTSVTTFAGLAPLLFEKSLQAQFLIPMAISVSFGLLASTVVLLILLPSLLVMLNRFRVNMQWLWNARKPAYKEVEPAYKELVDDKHLHEMK
ncbi:MAG: efflux RND transporter permease subunit, partial [Lewinella sp.]|nr:efflux RND transporter permease subunit [Lewinella sp.]